MPVRIRRALRDARDPSDAEARCEDHEAAGSDPVGPALAIRRCDGRSGCGTLPPRSPDASVIARPAGEPGEGSTPVQTPPPSRKPLPENRKPDTIPVRRNRDEIRPSVSGNVSAPEAPDGRPIFPLPDGFRLHGTRVMTPVLIGVAASRGEGRSTCRNTGGASPPEAPARPIVTPECPSRPWRACVGRQRSTSPISTRAACRQRGGRRP